MSCPLPVTDVLYQTAAGPHPDPLPQAGEGGEIRGRGRSDLVEAERPAAVGGVGGGGFERAQGFGEHRGEGQ